MNASIPAVLLLLVLSSAWLLGRRRSRPFLRSTDTSEVVALNRGQIERLQPSVPSPRAGASSSASLRPPAAAASSVTSPLGGSAAGPLTAGPPRQRLSQLRAAMAGSREHRLQALAQASQLPRRQGLPLLRMALRDPDPAVMAAAAAAMERFRGRSAAAPVVATEPRAWRGRPQPGSAATSPPRSVLRTR